MTRNKLSSKIKIGYGIGTLSYGIPFQLVSACFVFYATMVLGISGTLTGLLVSASTIWDAVTDPVMGYISDHTHKKIFLGRRLFYVLIGALGLALCTILLWQVSPKLPYVTKAVILGALLILLKTFSTIYATPYMALGAELSSDYDERTAVQSYRTAFFFLGFMFPTILGMAVFFKPTPEFADGQLNPQAYESLALVTAAITLVSAAVCIALTFRHQPPYTPPVKRKNAIIGISKETAEALKCNEFRNVSLSLLFVNMAMSIVGAIGMHIFTYTFGLKSGQIAIVFGALFIMALVAQPVWLFIANKYEKKTALKACLIINIGVTVLFFVYVLANAWVSAHYVAIIPVAMLIGFSMGGSIALPYSMITDTIDKDAYYSGTRKEGVFYGCATFMFKLSQSLAAVFAGTMLDIIGFNKGVDLPQLKIQIDQLQTELNHLLGIGQANPQIDQLHEQIAQINSHIDQASDVYLKLGLILPVGFLICFVLALIFVNKYTLNKEKVALYQSGLNANLPK